MTNPVSLTAKGKYIQLEKDDSLQHASRILNTVCALSRFAVAWYRPILPTPFRDKSLLALEKSCRDDVIKESIIAPRHWPFVRGIHRSPMNFPHKGQWRRALMFSLNGAWTNGWANHRHAGDLRRHLAHYDVTVMQQSELVRGQSSQKGVWRSTLMDLQLICDCLGTCRHHGRPPQERNSKSHILWHCLRQGHSQWEKTLCISPLIGWGLVHANCHNTANWIRHWQWKMIDILK